MAIEKARGSTEIGSERTIGTGKAKAGEEVEEIDVDTTIVGERLEEAEDGPSTSLIRFRYEFKTIPELKLGDVRVSPLQRRPGRAAPGVTFAQWEES